MITLKTLFLFAMSFFFTGFLSAQFDSINLGVQKPAMLELELKVKQNGAIGYANCFDGTVLRVNRGSLMDSKILITVLAGDKTNEDLLTSGSDSSVYIINFVFNKSNEEYRTTYITGFVDSGKTSWKIVEIRKDKEK